MKKISKPLSVRPKRSSFVFVCAKCVRKCEGGSAIRKALKGELRERSHSGDRRGAKLVETKCMGLCPKQAVVVAGGAMLPRGELLLLRRLEDVAPGVDLLERQAVPSTPPHPR